MIKWKLLKEEKPNPDKECLTIMKYGLISGYYNPEDGDFHGYYYMDMSWYAEQWVYVEEVIGAS